MKHAIMFGAGSIGRGFIGLLLEQAGYHVVFADVVQEVVDLINNNDSYTVHIVDDECSDVEIRNVSAIQSADPALVEEITKTDFITTAVSLGILPKIAPVIAAGISARRKAYINKPMNVIACENAIRGTSQLKAFVMEHLSEEDKAYAEEWVGFPDCVVDRIALPFREPGRADAMVERHFEWDVERTDIRGSFDPIPGMDIVDSLDAYLERKLFQFNGPHCVCASMGHLYGHEKILDAIDDPRIREVVWGIMEECAAMLVKVHGFRHEDLIAFANSTIKRFRNPYLKDETARVARDPMRKLAPNDRLIRPMLLCVENGLPIDHYVAGIAAVLRFNSPEDPASVEMQEFISKNGVLAFLKQHCGLPEDLAERIEAAYQALA